MTKHNGKRSVGLYTFIQAKLGPFEALGLPQSSLKETWEKKKKTWGSLNIKLVFCFLLFSDRLFLKVQTPSVPPVKLKFLDM